MPFIDIKDLRIHYQLDGPAAAGTLVLSNSLGTNLSLWEPQLLTYAKDFRVLPYDSRRPGQTHLAQALGHAPARQGHDVLFTTQTQLMSSLRTAQAMGTYERRFNYLAKVPLLLIDDFGLKPLRPPEDEDFHDLIAERYERAATVLTSNLDREEWGAAFPANKMIAAATLDRLRHGAYKIELDGESYRSLKPASEKSRPPAAKAGRSGAS